LLAGVHDRIVSEPKKPMQRLAFTGVHIMSPEILEHLPANGYSDILDVYLKLASRGERIGGFRATGHYWRDLGTVADYQGVHADLYSGAAPWQLIPQGGFWPFIHPEAHVHPSAKLRGWSCVGAGSRIGPDCILVNCLVLDNAIIKAGVRLREVVVADGALVCDSAEGGVVW
jgi:mannose-1-phosphate guanylyltransferase